MVPYLAIHPLDCGRGESATLPEKQVGCEIGANLRIGEVRGRRVLGPTLRRYDGLESSVSIHPEPIANLPNTQYHSIWLDSDSANKQSSHACIRPSSSPLSCRSRVAASYTLKLNLGCCLSIGRRSLYDLSHPACAKLPQCPPQKSFLPGRRSYHYFFFPFSSASFSSQKPDTSSTALPNG